MVVSLISGTPIAYNMSMEKALLANLINANYQPYQSNSAKKSESCKTDNSLSGQSTATLNKDRSASPESYDPARPADNFETELEKKISVEEPRSVNNKKNENKELISKALTDTDVNVEKPTDVTIPQEAADTRNDGLTEDTQVNENQVIVAQLNYANIDELIVENPQGQVSSPDITPALNPDAEVTVMQQGPGYPVFVTRQGNFTQNPGETIQNTDSEKAGVVTDTAIPTEIVADKPQTDNTAIKLPDQPLKPASPENNQPIQQPAQQLTDKTDVPDATAKTVKTTEGTDISENTAKNTDISAAISLKAYDKIKSPILENLPEETSRPAAENTAREENTNTNVQLQQINTVSEAPKDINQNIAAILSKRSTGKEHPNAQPTNAIQPQDMKTVLDQVISQNLTETAKPENITAPKDINQNIAAILSKRSTGKEHPNTQQDAQPTNAIQPQDMKTALDQVISQNLTETAKPENITAPKENNAVQTSLTRQLEGNITNIISRADDNRVTIQLNPPQLGKVTIKLEQNADQITGVLEVSKDQTRAEIQQILPAVMKNLSNMGLDIRKIDVVPESSSQLEQNAYKDLGDGQFDQYHNNSSDSEHENSGKIGIDTVYDILTQDRDIYFTDSSINMLA